MSLNRLFPSSDGRTVGAALESNSAAANAIAAQAIAAALNAVKSGKGTPEQQAAVVAMAKQAIQQTGKSFEELKGDQRSISVILPPPAPPIPIEVNVADVAKAAEPFMDVSKGAIDVAQGWGSFYGDGMKKTGAILSWIGAHPRASMAIAAAGLGAFFFGPTVAPLILRKLAIKKASK